MKVLVTGNAGFIGFHLARTLLERGDEVVGIDCVNDYYDPDLKEARLAELAATASRAGAKYSFLRENLADRDAVDKCFADHQFDRVVNLAAQAGVRYSLTNPHAYVESNIVGFTNLLEACRHAKVGHFIYASTSSVYGANTSMPLSEHDGANHPLQFYAATKRANELMAHAYSHLYGLPTTGLRFFTVYGPWGRPDMALFLFTRNILDEKPIDVFNFGKHTRDFTYVDDIVSAVARLCDTVAAPNAAWDSSKPDPATSNAPFQVLNIGNSSPIALNDYIETLEKVLGKTAMRNLLPLQPGDIPGTFADVTELRTLIGYQPRTTVEEGIARFVEWYRSYYKV